MRKTSFPCYPSTFKTRTGFALALVAAAALSACGGGGSSAVDPLAPAGATELEKVAVLYGIDASGIGGDGSGDGGAAGAAGDGAPLKRAVVTLTDAKGNQVTGQTDDNGKFLLKYKTANFTAPLVLRVIDAGGNILSSVTDESAATGKAIRASINPLTDKITSDVIPASVSGTDKTFNGASVDTTKLVKAKADLLTSINAALGTAGIADAKNFDAVKSVYGYDGKGVDAIIESISHARDASTGATQLRAKLVGLSTNADGTVAPTLITAGTPLPTTAVALSTSPALTFDKMNAWVTEVNRCLALPKVQRQADVNCDSNASGSRFTSPDFKQNSKDFEADFSTLLSEADKSAVQGSTLRNASILFLTRATGSTVDDRAVVEVTIRQPRTGPLAGNITEPIEYTKILVFKRDDTLTRAAAGNWILHGNQKSFNWSMQPRNTAVQQLNAASTLVSHVRSGIEMTFSTTAYDATSQTYKASDVYAVRIKGPGLPTAGIVLTPQSVNNSGNFAIHNKTGTIPTPGTTAPRPQRDFRYPALGLSTKAAVNVCGTTIVYCADAAPDYAQLQAYNRYTAEIYTNAGGGVPITETTTLLAPVQNPTGLLTALRHDLTPSTNVVQAPQPSMSSVTVSWVRTPGATRIESAGFYRQSSGATNIVSLGTNLADAFTLTPTSTSAVVSNGALPLPATPNATGEYREVNLYGTAARAAWIQALAWSFD